MLGVHSDFSKLWKEFTDEWSNEPEDLPHYLLISDVVRKCSKMLAEGEKHNVDRVFEVVERWLVEGDPYVREAATVGFIEDLQNVNLHDGTEPRDFIQFLGPESSYWWTKVERFWSHGEPLVDDR